MNEDKDIWLVDDDEVFRLIVKGLLEGTGYADRVAYFDDGDRAVLNMVGLAKKGAHGPKLVFLDLSMKHLEGWQLIDLLNEFKSEVNVVILTSSVGLNDRARAEKEPLVKGYLTKPVDRSQLMECISNLGV